MEEERLKMPLFWIEPKERLTSPRQMVCEVIGVHLACKLNKLWHSRLPEIQWSNVVRNKYHVEYGANYYGCYYAIAIWSSPVARLLDDTTMLELRRLAIAPDAPKYTATWMIARMIQDIKIRFSDIRTLISYQDTQVHTGIIYKASNWTCGKETQGGGWTRPNRSRQKTQSNAKKIRWEYQIRKKARRECEKKSNCTHLASCEVHERITS